MFLFAQITIKFPTFPLTCIVVVKTLWHYCASMWCTATWYRLY